MKKTIAVVYGGKSPEHEVSCDSAAAIIKELTAGGYDTKPVYISRKGTWLLQNPEEIGTKNGVEIFPSVPKSCFTDKHGNVSLKPDLLFPIIHGTTGEDGVMQGFFELMDIPYSGCGVTASACGMDKAVAKGIVKAAGINVLPHVIVRKYEMDTVALNDKIAMAEKMGFPLFVKPVSQGSSVGTTKVKNKEMLIPAIEKALQFDTAAMIEKGVDMAREIVCGVLGGIKECSTVPAGEVCVQGSHEFYDYEAKYLDNDGMKLLIPAPITAVQMEYVRKSSEKIFLELGCRGFARVDFFVDRKSGDIWFGEINTAPGFTFHSLYPAMWKAAGIPVIEVLEKIINYAFEAFDEKHKLSIIR